MASARFVKQLPPTRAGKYKRGPHQAHRKIHERLHKKPGEWLPIPCSSVGQAARLGNAIKTSKYIAFKDATYDAHIRGSVVYARLVV